MAAAQQCFQHPQIKGTLMPGQTIVVNKHTIQVERYLSQGGFAHVYLVRTPAPIYNTTHHVLKRIAVPDQTMLAEVKKEVDIMRLLKGHPNIVHFIDAAWHKMPNGMFEVFILMEYCPGGGIIDMMNRRLRERLTEAEILQIFVDVCEAVAYMHNLRPPLLHRDLKVENILQSSGTSFKLCDFGSTTAVAKAPTNMQELRALEADLNKHTTIQYRAPEMIDVHMRRPIDEKSDVWALGVLLYKLCYYTTPFEEHGPLAILQVSYKIPPYPVYSPQLNFLIGKMLKDHGSMRPTVFEVLCDIHRMRGTKSQYQYSVPASQPLSPSRLPQPKQPPLGALDGVITYKSRSPSKHQSSPSLPPIKSQGHLAREKVMEAIAPMRRGRETTSKNPSQESKPNSRPSSPQKDSNRQSHMGVRVNKPKFDEIAATEDEKAWKTWTTDANRMAKPPPTSNNDDAWKIGNEKEIFRVVERMGFSDNFGERLRASTETPTFIPQVSPRTIVTPKSSGHSPSPSKETFIPTRYTPQATTGNLSRKIPLPRSEKDAFDGLGLDFTTEKPQPTLGEARKLRTGLAILGSPRTNKLESESRPVASPKPSFLSPQPYTRAHGFLSTSPSNASGSGTPAQAVSRPPSSMNIDGLPIESRFPSLEDLDTTFPASRDSQSSSHPPLLVRPPNTLQEPRSGGTAPNKVTSQDKQGSGHTRVFEISNDSVDNLRLNKGRALPSTMIGGMPPRRVSSLSLKPTITRRQRTSISFKHVPASSGTDASTPSQALPPDEEHSSRSRTPPSHSRDWLTGDGNLPLTPTKVSISDMPILRKSPSKRASFIDRSNAAIREGITARPEQASPVQQLDNELSSVVEISPTITKFTQLYPSIETTRKAPVDDSWNTPASHETDDSSSSSAEEGPEDVNGLSLAAKSDSFGRSRRQARQSSVHNLVDLWGGGVQNNKDTTSRNLNEEKVSPGKEREAGISSVPKVPPSPIKKSSSPEPRPISYLEPEKQPPRIEPKASPTSDGRPRPQSLFLFPSRGADSSSQQSSLLDAPPEAKRRQSRRNSVTDIVERYEAMDGNPVAGGSGSRPPSPLAIKKTSSGKSVPPLESGRTSKLSEARAPLAPLTVPGSPSESPWKQLSSPTRMKVSPVLPSTDRRVQPERTTATGVSRARKQSLKFENLKPPVSLHSLLVADEKKERPVGAERSPSPERSYQGVGKLIDKWQRKAEEVEPGRNAAGPKRSSIIGKRPATMTAGKSQ